MHGTRWQCARENPSFNTEPAVRTLGGSLKIWTEYTRNFYIGRTNKHLQNIATQKSRFPGLKKSSVCTYASIKPECSGNSFKCPRTRIEQRMCLERQQIFIDRLSCQDTIKKNSPQDRLRTVDCHLYIQYDVKTQENRCPQCPVSTLSTDYHRSSSSSDCTGSWSLLNQITSCPQWRLISQLSSKRARLSPVLYENKIATCPQEKPGCHLTSMRTILFPDLYNNRMTKYPIRGQIATCPQRTELPPVLFEIQTSSCVATCPRSELMAIRPLLGQAATCPPRLPVLHIWELCRGRTRTSLSVLNSLEED